MIPRLLGLNIERNVKNRFFGFPPLGGGSIFLQILNLIFGFQILNLIFGIFMTIFSCHHIQTQQSPDDGLHAGVFSHVWKWKLFETDRVKDRALFGGDILGHGHHHVAWTVWWYRTRITRKSLFVELPNTWEFETVVSAVIYSPWIQSSGSNSRFVMHFRSCFQILNLIFGNTIANIKFNIWRQELQGVFAPTD